MRRQRPPLQQSLDGHALGQIAWFIDIAAQLDSEMVSEQLKRDRRENWAHTIWHFRYGDDLVGDAFQLLGPIPACDNDERAFAGLNLLDVVQVFRKNGVIR